MFAGELLSTITVPDDIINRHDLQCERHYTFIESCHANIVFAMINAAKDIIPYTKPCSRHCLSRFS